MVDALTEWTALGLRLLQLCPDRFDEIVECLRETVGAQEILSPATWLIAVVERGSQPSGKA